MQDIHALADEYREEWNVPGLKLTFNTSRGYHLLLPSALEALPDGVCQAVKTKAHIACSTEDLLSLNERVKVRGLQGGRVAS